MLGRKGPQSPPWGLPVLTFDNLCSFHSPLQQLSPGTETLFAFEDPGVVTERGNRCRGAKRGLTPQKPACPGLRGPSYLGLRPSLPHLLQSCMVIRFCSANTRVFLCPQALPTGAAGLSQHEEVLQTAASSVCWCPSNTVIDSFGSH